MVLLLSSESQDPFEVFPLQTTTWQSRVFWRPETSSLFLRHQRYQVMTWELPTIFIQTRQKPKNPRLIWCWVSARKSLIPEAPPHCVPRRAGCRLQGPPHGRQYIDRFGCQLPNNSCMHRIPQICRGFWYYFHRHSVDKKEKDVWKTKSHKFSPTWSNSCCSRGLMPRKTCSKNCSKPHKKSGFWPTKCFKKFDCQGSVSSGSSSFAIKQWQFAQCNFSGSIVALRLPVEVDKGKAWRMVQTFLGTIFHGKLGCHWRPFFWASWPGPVWSESFFPGSVVFPFFWKGDLQILMLDVLGKAISQAKDSH